MEVDLQEDGILWAINRVLFHPRGYALAYDTNTNKFYVIGDGNEIFCFTNKMDDNFFEKFESMLKEVQKHGA